MHITYSRIASSIKNRSRLCAALINESDHADLRSRQQHLLFFKRRVKLLCVTKKGKLHLTDIHKTESDSQPSWDYLVVLGAWVWAESPVCHRVHLCSQQQQHSWARLSSSSLLPPLMDSVWINSFHHWYYALGAYLQILMGKNWYKLLGEWREVLASAKYWRRESVLPVCSLSVQSSNALGMHKLLLCWPSTAGQRAIQIKHHMNCEYGPPNPCEGSQSLGQPYRSRQFW